VLIKPHQKGLS